ncbi:MAG: arsenate reductase/protein-tyrosine-phosphatase family protein [Promethearchaeota archaeon]
MIKIKHVLFVCLGNTARSPAAEYLARNYARKNNSDLIITSAGFINAFSYMQPESQEYLNARGIIHSDFIPQLINRELLENQDLILTMERLHSIDIINNYRFIEDIDKITFTLKEFNGEAEDLDIIDPYYTSSKKYKQVLKIIDQNVERAIKKIITSNNSFCV